MIATRSSPKKTSKASRASKTTRNPPPSTPAGITKPRRATKPSSRRSQQGRYVTRSSPDTASVDEVPETNLKATHDADVIADLKRRLAKLEDGHQVTEPSSRRRRRHHARHSSISESESKKNDERHTNRVSFVHTEGTRPFLALHSRYRAVDIKYFKQILHGTFKAENLTKLGHNLTNKGASDAPQDPKEITQILQCFGVYAMAIIFFAKAADRFDLTMALEEYRYRLADYSYSYKFDSVKEYNYAFITARLLDGQDNHLAWKTEDQRCVHKVFLTSVKSVDSSEVFVINPFISKSAIVGEDVAYQLD